MPRARSKDLGTKRSLQHACRLNGPQQAWGDLLGGGWGFHSPSSTVPRHGEGHGQTGGKAAPSVSAAHPRGRRMKQRRKLSPLIPSLRVTRAPPAEGRKLTGLHRTALKLVLNALQSNMPES